MGGEGRRIVGDADADGATVVRRVVNAVGDSHAAGIGGEVVIVHRNGRAIPFGAGVLEVADQFAFLAMLSTLMMGRPCRWKRVRSELIC